PVVRLSRDSSLASRSQDLSLVSFALGMVCMGLLLWLTYGNPWSSASVSANGFKVAPSNGWSAGRVLDNGSEGATIKYLEGETRGWRGPDAPSRQGDTGAWRGDGAHTFTENPEPLERNSLVRSTSLHNGPPPTTPGFGLSLDSAPRQPAEELPVGNVGQGQGEEPWWVNGAGSEHRAGGEKRPENFDEEDVLAVSEALARYSKLAQAVLERDIKAVEEGGEPKGKYILLESGNELVNRLRGVVGGLLLGLLTDRVFVADVTYQLDAGKNEGLLSMFFEGPGYQWDLSQLPHALTSKLLRQGTWGAGKRASRLLSLQMTPASFGLWACDDLTKGAEDGVVTLHTILYPLPLLVRNPAYASHPLLAGALGGGRGRGFVGGVNGGQGRVEALEVLLVRGILWPREFLREEAAQVERRVRAEAEEWGRQQGLAQPPRVVGLHIRSFYVKAMSPMV
ncbi:unnamed protein product, partial [Discosporangium mesarthrocarpum]